jgi:hypothetical protein
MSSSHVDVIPLLSLWADRNTQATLHSGFAFLIGFGSLIEKVRLDKASRIHSSESDRRGVIPIPPG